MRSLPSRCLRARIGGVNRLVVTASRVRASFTIAFVLLLSLSVIAVAAADVPANTSPPAINGTLKEGQTLTLSNGVWTNSPTSWAYQWQRCDSVGYAQAVLSDAPAAFWRFNETSGASLADSSPNGNTATATSVTLGAIGATTGDSANTAITLNGTTAYAQASNSTSLNSPKQAITLEAWVKPTAGSFGSYKPVILKSYTSHVAPYYQYGLFMADYGSVPKTVRIALAIGGAFVTFDAPNSGWQYGVWNHIAGTYDGATLRVYVNGVQAASRAQSGAISTYATSVTIGRYANLAVSSSYLFSGGVDEPAVYPAALSGDAIFDHFNSAPHAPAGSCAAIAGATSATYVLGQGDIGAHLVGAVTATNANGSATAFSPLASVIAAAGSATGIPANTAPPTISGQPFVGQTLTAAPGSWTNSPFAYTYQWQRCDSGGASCSNISGATSPDYEVAGADKASTIRVQVTARNSYGTAVASSAATSPVDGPPTVQTRPAVIGFAAATGSTLEAFPGIWQGTDPTTYGYQWQRCDGSSCSNISGATAPTYEATENDATSRLRVVVTATDSVGSASASSPLSAVDYRTVMLASNPVGYWRLNELGGTTMVDSSGNGNDGLYRGAPGYGAVGAPIQDPDTAKAFLYTNPVAFPYVDGGAFGSPTFTLDLWIKPSQLPGTNEYARIVSGGQYATTGFDLELIAGNQFSFGIRSTPHSVTIAGGAAKKDVWQHLIGTFDGTALSLYVDGVLVASAPAGSNTYLPWDAAQRITFGAVETDQPGFMTQIEFLGAMDETALYDRALTLSEIAEHFALGVGSLEIGQTYGAGELAVDPSAAWPGSVDSATGQYFTSTTDATLPGIGEAFDWTRSYNSGDTLPSAFGPGWRFKYGAHAYPQANGDVVVTGGYGQQVRFTKRSDGTYQGPTGSLATLTASEPPGSGWSLVTNDQSHQTFDGNGRLTSMEDRNGQGVTLSYDASGYLTSITDSVGRQIGVSVNAASGHITSITLPGTTTNASDLRSVTYSYDGSGRLAQVEGLHTSGTSGPVTIYTYDGTSSRLASITDANNHLVVQNTWDATAGRVIEQTDGFLQALGQAQQPQVIYKRSYGWTDGGATATYTDPRGHTSTHYYSGMALIKSVDQLGNTTTYSYRDGSAQPSSIVDPRGNVTGATASDYTTTFVYDDRGNTLQRTTPLAIEKWTYNARNDVTSHTDARGHTTTFGYDGNGNLTSKTEPGNVVTQYGRDPVTGVMTSETDPRGKTTTLGYDSQWNLISKTSPLSEKQTMSYDAAGRMITSVDPRGNVTGATASDYTTSFAYDAQDRKTSETDPLGHATSWSYDPVGNLTGKTDANNHTISYAYDAGNHLTTVTAPGGATTSYTYDPDGSLSRRADANDHVTSYGYDDADQRTSMTDPLNRIWTYAYDAAGNQTQVVAPGNGTTTIGYDALNRRTSIGYSDGTPSLSFQYDGNGNRTQMSDGAGTETLTYDDLNRVTAVTRGSDTFSYSYDAAGNITSRTYPGGIETSYTYDDDGRLLTATSGGKTTSYSYDAAGNPTSATLPAANGYVETRSYDRAGRLVQLKNAAGTSILSQFDYSYDPVGNPTTIEKPGGAVESYGYDNRDRLLSVCYQTSCPNGSDPKIAWTYDDVGNRLTETRTTGTTTYSYDAADQLTSESGPAGSVTHTYDARGNETQDGDRTFAYDLADRLVSTTASGVTTNYAYDGDDNRLSATSGSTTTTFLWDTNYSLAQLALERDGSGTVTRSYIHGRDTISMGSGGASYYYHYDGLGSVVNLTDATGQNEWSYSYEPYGEERTTVRGDPSAPDNPLRFTGEYRDQSGLYNLRARMYDPTDGRFLQQDPVAGIETEPFTGSYAYVGDRPLFGTDPSGQLCWKCVAGGLLDGVREAPSFLVHGELAGIRAHPSTALMMVMPEAAAARTGAARSATAGVKLARSLASREQMSGPGRAIIGAGTNRTLRAADRLAEHYGGRAGEWAKMASRSHTGRDGFTFETHWYENVRTGLRVEQKTKLGGYRG